MLHVLCALREYLSDTRQCGHTQAILEGARRTDGVVVVVGKLAEASLLKKRLPAARFVSLDMLYQLKGLRKPLLLDNAALFQLLDRAIHDWGLLQQAHSKAVAEVAGLTEQLSRVTDEKQALQRQLEDLRESLKLMDKLRGSPRRSPDSSDGDEPPVIQEKEG